MPDVRTNTKQAAREIIGGIQVRNRKSRNFLGCISKNTGGLIYWKKINAIDLPFQMVPRDYF